jgi:hypothetical protein
LNKSLRELLEEDEKVPMEDEELDDAIWLCLCKEISKPEDLKRFQPPVAVYYANYLMEAEVGNGGFSQAAFNMPEWFEPAAEAYRSLGKPIAANLIMEVHKLLPYNEEIASKLRAGEIEWEDYFVDHDFDIYDKRAYASNEWEIAKERIAYVRANREAFKK